MNLNIFKLVILLCLLINTYSTSFATIILAPDEYTTIQLAINAAIGTGGVLAWKAATQAKNVFIFPTIFPIFRLQIF